MKRFFLSLTFMLFVCTQPVRAETHQGWQTSISGGAQLSFFDLDDTSMGTGFDLGVIQKLYFHEHIGLFFGATFSQRQLRLNVTALTPRAVHGSGRYIDIPFGLSFQMEAWEVGYAQIDVGAFYGIAVSDYVIEGLVSEAKGFFGIYSRMSFIFPIDDTFYLGPVFGLKYGLSDSVDATTTLSLKNFDLNAGLSGQLLF